ncbi:MAG: hypothetical protein HYT98_03100 [Candidatus Sungbacteria bacterium]|nr:hypothetical protein [Candidatus Sungbacteria bacterium]
MLTKPTEAQIKKACEFWAGKLGKFNAFFQTKEERKDPANRETSYEETRATVDGQQHAAQFSTAEAKERLKVEIRKYLREHEFEFVPDLGRRVHICLDVDYHPRYDFFDIVDKAGLDPHDFLFPIKTQLVIKPDGGVVVFEGINAEPYEI